MGRASRWSRRRPSLLALGALGLVSACYASAGTEPNTVDITGTWTFTESFNDVAHGISCADTGSYEISQMGTAFSGTYTQRGVCPTPQGAVSNADAGAVTAGRMAGHTLRFAAPNCAYDGSVNAPAGDRIDGHVACELRDSTQTLSFAGSWKASR